MQNDFITIVAGAGRCGTSLLMQMLHAGGMPVIADNKESFESERTEPDIYRENTAWLQAGHALKIT
jgi:hypothetical protein